MHKLENAEEDIVFLQTDINELKEEKSETEMRLRAELTSLQAEMSAISMSNSYYYSVHNIDTLFVLQYYVAYYIIDNALCAHAVFWNYFHDVTILHDGFCSNFHICS